MVMLELTALDGLQLQNPGSCSIAGLPDVSCSQSVKCGVFEAQCLELPNPLLGCVCRPHVQWATPLLPTRWRRPPMG